MDGWCAPQVESGGLRPSAREGGYPSSAEGTSALPLLFCSFQALSGLADAHLHWREPPHLLSQVAEVEVAGRASGQPGFPKGRLHGDQVWPGILD